MKGLPEFMKYVDETLEQESSYQFQTLITRFWPQSAERPDLDRIHKALLGTGKYLIERGEIGGNMMISKSPNYEINQSLIIANKSSVSANYWVKRMAIVSTVIAAITGAFIAGTFFKDDAPNLQPINTQLELIRQSQDSMRKFQKGIDSSLQTMAKDSSKKIFVVHDLKK